MSLDQPDTERLRGAFASLASVAASGTDCPEPEMVWRAVRGEISPAEIRRQVDHTAACPSCAEDWRLAREMGTGLGAFVEKSSRPTVANRPTWYLVAAAVLAMAVGAFFWHRATEPEDPAEYRAMNESPFRSLTPEDIPLPRDNARFRWTLEGESESFTLRVATEDFDTLSLARGLKSSEYQVPVTDLEGLASGSRLLWQIEAQLSNGARVVSPTFVNRLE